MYKLYDFLPSGNGYKVRLLLKLLDISFTRIELNILNRETRTPEFLTKNPNGKIPLLEIAPDKFLAESNAKIDRERYLEAEAKELTKKAVCMQSNSRAYCDR